MRVALYMTQALHCIANIPVFVPRQTAIHIANHDGVFTPVRQIRRHFVASAAVLNSFPVAADSDTNVWFYARTVVKIALCI